MEGTSSRRLQAKDPDLKVLYLTGFADHLFDEKGNVGRGVPDKPFTPDGLAGDRQPTAARPSECVRR